MESQVMRVWDAVDDIWSYIPNADEYLSPAEITQWAVRLAREEATMQDVADAIAEKKKAGQ